MTDATTDFFEQLGARGHEPLLENATGTVRFELTDGKRRAARWLVSIERGDVAVSHKNVKADCVVRGDAATLAGIAAGKVNPFAATLRGAIGVEGDTEVLVLFQRLLPAPPNSKE